MPHLVQDNVSAVIPGFRETWLGIVPEVVGVSQGTTEHFEKKRVEISALQPRFELRLFQRQQLHVDPDVGELLLDEQREPLEPGIVREHQAREPEATGHAAVTLRLYSQTSSVESHPCDIR